MLQNLTADRNQQMINAIKMAKNPQAMLQNMPQYKQIMNYIQQNGGNAKEAFYNKAREMGVNPDEFLNQLKS